jgi:hypothetical protein
MSNKLDEQYRGLLAELIYNSTLKRIEQVLVLYLDLDIKLNIKCLRVFHY